MPSEHRFDAMGTRAHVIVLGPTELTHVAEARVEDLEARWSRFRPTSEISRLNASPGVPQRVSTDTVRLIRAAVDGWVLSRGRFDPTVHDVLVALGYRDRLPVGEVGAVGPVGPVPGCAGIEIDQVGGQVVLPEGTAFDPGGIGKGLAADIVVAELLERGAEGALVSIGGDLAVGGTPPDGDGWTIEIDHPRRSGCPVVLARFASGGLATSSRTRRTWSAGGAEVHHLLDPATAAPADTRWASATVVAGSAAWAEVLAKVAFLDGNLDPSLGAPGVLVDEDGEVRRIGADGAGWFYPVDVAA
jgi:FAD:protein FMN transferase